MCLSCVYLDGHSYQENLLVQQNVNDGNHVNVIASTESLDNNGNTIYLEPKNYTGTDGAFVYRVPYNQKIPKIIQSKIRSYEGVFALLDEIKPDLIYFHGLSAFELRTLLLYKEKNPKIKIILDCHSDKYNSALTFYSKIFHKFFYKPIFKSILKEVDKIFCISMDTMDFAIDFYEAPKNKVEFYPLGGVCLDDENYNSKRFSKRKELNINADKIMLLQTGKLNRRKHLIEALREFKKNSDDRFIYVVAGSLDKDIEEEALSLISEDKRIKYLGWVDANEIQKLLCASDLYIQPGSQSATMQQSLCLRNAVILKNVKSHKPFVKGNGWLINRDSEISEILDNISLDPDLLLDMSKKSLEIAHNLLSYDILAQKIYRIF
nr:MULTISPECIES: glycosyltransferase family 4 protein [unclassified Acinetobacter]